MIGDYYTFNGDLRPAAEAVVPIDDIAFAYGYGVYETLKLRKGVVFFPDRHAGAYDALLVNREGQITEGTRTNLFKIHYEPYRQFPTRRFRLRPQTIREQGQISWPPLCQENRPRKLSRSEW